jgi:hypothetical protein
MPPDYFHAGRVWQAAIRPIILALILADEIPGYLAARREGRGFSPATENGSSLGALAPEGTRLQGLKAQLVGLPGAAGLKPRPSQPSRYHGDFPP